jgi:hypothetical protein
LKKKTRKVSFDDPVPVDITHLDGGTVGIVEMEYDSAEDYSAAVTKTEFERDDRGNLIFNRSGDPIRRFVNNTHEEIRVAAGRVAYVRDLEDQDKNPVTLPGGFGVDVNALDKNLLKFLKFVGSSEIPVDTEGMEFIGAPGQVRAKTIPQVGPDEKKKPLANAKVGADGFVVIEVQEPIWKWVVRESSRLRRERNELLRKNS